MHLVAHPTFVAEDGHTVKFIPLGDLPGFSHRVIVDRAHVGFLAATFKPNAKAAKYFLSEEFKTKARP